MPRSKKKVLPFTIIPNNVKSQKNLEVLNIIKNSNDISSERVQNITGLSQEYVLECIDTYGLKDLINIGSDNRGVISLKINSNIFLGIGFSDDKCFITKINSSGDILDSETIDIEPLHKFKGKKKEVMEILRVLKQDTNFRKQPITLCGIAVPEKIIQASEKNAALLFAGIGRIFNADVYFCRSVTASGYGERESDARAKGKDVLYLHSDIGCGVIMRGEVLFQAENENREDDSSYLRSWKQFGIVEIAKDLVNKGVGSSLANMVKGKIDEVTLDMVLAAAEQEDELAKDLVVRSALALGVRVAYLANVFEVCTVILGGGMEGKRGIFEDFVKESAKKFLKKKLEGNVNIFGGKLGVKAASLGAANLCIRELFLEV